MRDVVDPSKRRRRTVAVAGPRIGVVDVSGGVTYEDVPFHLASRMPCPEVVLVEIIGELDLATEPRARAYLAECTANEPDHLIVDLSRVTFLPSHGLHLLLAAHHNENAIQGALHVVGVQGNRHVEPQLALTGLLTLLDVRPDLSSLLAELDPGQEVLGSVVQGDPRSPTRYRADVTGRESHGSIDASDPPERLMTLTSRSIGSAAVVEVAGELDLHTAPDLMAAVDDAVARDPGLSVVIIDLSRVDFLGSSGLGILANLATRATAPDQRGTALRIVAPADHRPVVRPWEAMNLQQILPLHPDVDAALNTRG